MLILYSIVFVLFVVGIFISVSFLFSLQDINLSQHVYLNKLTKSHNSSKTCNIAKSNLYGHLHFMLVIVCGYKQNPSRSGGGVAHTRFRVVRTNRLKDGRTYGEVQILMPTHNFVGGIIKEKLFSKGLGKSYRCSVLEFLRLCSSLNFNENSSIIMRKRKAIK